MNRALKRRVTRVTGQPGVELENHFVLRLRQPQAEVLRELLRSPQSSNVKDRLFIQLDSTGDKDDMRNGIITFDTLMSKARLVDMPTIIESWKTIDGKNFYKTADICQMLMVRDDEEQQEEEEIKKKRKDHPNRVDKKYLWPHGITPPLKNVRKRRFRKTLRKKILELPEIEKEVKRLLRADEEAYSVKWEILREDEMPGASGGGGGSGGAGEASDQHHSTSGPSQQVDDSSQGAPANLNEQLFGEMLSSSEDEVGPQMNYMDEDEDSRLSVEDSRFSENYTQNDTNSPLSSRQSFQPTSSRRNQGTGSSASNVLAGYVTEFTSSMFDGDDTGGAEQLLPSRVEEISTTQNLRPNYLAQDRAMMAASLQQQLLRLEGEVAALQAEEAAQKRHMDVVDNLALKSRFQAKLLDVQSSIDVRLEQINGIKSALG